MDEWMKLTDNGGAYIRRGSVLRIPKSPQGTFDWYPDAYTDFLIFDPAKDGVYGLMVSSGHKSGMTYLIFPSESKGNNAIGLQRACLIDNWRKWVYPDGTPDEVWIRGPKSIDSLDAD